MLDGVRFPLRRNKWRIIILLVLARGQWVSRNTLMDALYGERLDPPFDEVLYSLIHRLRRTFRGTRLNIEGQCGLGWRALLSFPANDPDGSKCL